MDRFTCNSCSQHEMPEGEWTDADARVATSEDIRRETFNIPQQISICGSNTSERETLKPDLSERLEQLGKEFSASSGSIIQKEKENYEKLQERIRDLEARNEKLLSKALSMHKQSENLNDPFRLSAVLDMYRMLKLHEWGKCWSSSARLSYPKASNIIKKLFDACERDIEKRKTGTFEILGFPLSHDAANTCKQELMPDIMKLLRYGYYLNDSGINKIIKHADVPLKNIEQEQFAVKCCRVFCLLLLQDSPVKAVWNIHECSLQYLEHVDQQDLKYCRAELRILWPMLMNEVNVIERGVVWN
ncbi:uncharacterized protein LOC128073452 isoform X1 [Tympanuchus pallidicinctus]|uniref:uncharacterized protein LOC128073452 isoform X1 n=1 Tax=Tympanuchus pallidicinctus TaxID=109042 RepID=UPI002286E454|nr:uncharacterized protein LOC128073452 isoform X1 [Tympanuchus pallidicinctus]